MNHDAGETASLQTGMAPLVSQMAGASTRVLPDFHAGIVAALSCPFAGDAEAKRLFKDVDVAFPLVPQDRSGYCWLFAALHFVSSQYAKCADMREFRISRSHLIFWDKAEKANWFLEHVLQLPPTPDDRSVQYLLRRAMSDRGQWAMAVNLIRKYGVVSDSSMKDVPAAADTAECNAALSLMLRADARDIHGMRARGASTESLRQEKNEMLAQALRFLELVYGVPPERMERPSACSGRRSGAGKPDLPSFVDFPFGDYCSILVSGRDERLHSTDVIELDGNLVEGELNSCAHVTRDEFAEAVRRQVRSESACWVSCDAGKFGPSAQGVFDDRKFDLSLLGDRYREMWAADDAAGYLLKTLTHAMTIIAAGEGSTGGWWMALDSAGSEGCVRYLSDSWFQKFVFQAVVRKEYLPMLPENPVVRRIKPWEVFHA